MLAVLHNIEHNRLFRLNHRRLRRVHHSLSQKRHIKAVDLSVHSHISSSELNRSYGYQSEKTSLEDDHIRDVDSAVEIEVSHKSAVHPCDNGEVRVYELALISGGIPRKHLEGIFLIRQHSNIDSLAENIRKSTGALSCFQLCTLHLAALSVIDSAPYLFERLVRAHRT